jgi:hypothetical protein
MAFPRAFLLLLFSLAISLSGCGSSSFNPPLMTGSTIQAVNDSFDVLGNATVTYSEALGVRANDNHGGALVGAFDSTTTAGGTVAVNPDGSFEYTPPVGFKGVDTFTYTLAGQGGSSTATATLTIDSLAYFVNNTAPDGGDGSQGAPFDNLAAALAVPPVAGDFIFVFRGDGTNNGLAGAVVLPPGVSLVGEGIGLDFPNPLLGAAGDVLAQQIVSPGQFPSLTGPITVSQDNLVAGLSLEKLNRNFIAGSNVSNTVIAHNRIATPTFGEPSVILSDYTGKLVFADNEFTGVGVKITQSQSGTLAFYRNSFTEGGGTPMDLTFSGGTNDIEVVDNSAPSWTRLFLMETSNNAVTNVTATGNQTFGNSVGIDVNSKSSGSTTFNFSNNTIAGLIPIRVAHVNGPATGAVNDNALTLADSGNPGIWLESDSPGGKFEVANNTIDDPGFAQKSIYFVVAQNIDSKLQLRDNTVSGSGGGFVAVDFGRHCIDMTGNVFPTVDFGGVLCDVERFSSKDGGPLSSVNTIGTIKNQSSVTSRPAGYCGF